MKKTFSFSLVAFSICLLFLGCKEPNLPTSIFGTWQSPPYDTYIITETTITYDDGGYGFGWSDNILKIQNNFIYHQANSGEIRASHFKNLSDIAVRLTTCYRADGVKCYTLEEAISEFKIENGYFEYYGEYEKK